MNRLKGVYFGYVHDFLSNTTNTKYFGEGTGFLNSIDNAEYLQGDWGLYLADKTIGSPEPFTYYVEIPGRDGKLDLTDEFLNSNGVVHYRNRTVSMTFVAKNADTSWASIYSKVASYLHGKNVYFMFEDDRSWYYYGRAKINSFKTNRFKATIVIDVDCEPYKREYRNHSATYTNDIDGETSAWLWDELDFYDGYIYQNIFYPQYENRLILYSRGMPVKPYFKATVESTVTVSGQTFLVPADDAWHEAPEYLRYGENIVYASSTGTLYCNYRGGEL